MNESTTGADESRGEGLREGRGEGGAGGVDGDATAGSAQAPDPAEGGGGRQRGAQRHSDRAQIGM